MRASAKLLNERDLQIIFQMAEGQSYSSISNNLGLKEITVKKMIRVMMQERGFTSPYQLITWAYQDALIV